MSPSIHPLPTVARPAGAVALPSGLGAGGRGKEKAPCRYLHYAVDLSEDNNDRNGSMQNDQSDEEEEDVYGGSLIRNGREEKPKRTHRIEVGLGPIGKGYQIVCIFVYINLLLSLTTSLAPTSMALLRPTAI